MKAGDLLRHNGNHSLWLLVDVAEDLSGQSILIVAAKTGYKMWADTRGFEVINESR